MTNPKHLLFRWIVLRIVIGYIFWEVAKRSEIKPPLPSTNVCRKNTQNVSMERLGKIESMLSFKYLESTEREN